MRCQQPGWIQVANHDPSGRRGLWYRRNADSTLEVCAGRDGDDWYAKVSPGQTLTGLDVYELFECLRVAADVLYCNPVTIGKE